jgi:hypothetical protein
MKTKYPTEKRRVPLFLNVLPTSKRKLAKLAKSANTSQGKAFDLILEGTP